MANGIDLAIAASRPLALSDLRGLQSEPPHREMSLGAALSVLRRQRRFVCIWMALTLAPACFAIWNLRPRYRAEALVALDTRQIQFSEMSAVITSPASITDPNFVRSELAILGSDATARSVVADLGLQNLPEFAPVPGRSVRLLTWVATEARALGGPLTPIAERLDDVVVWIIPPMTPEARFDAAVRSYRTNMGLSNDGRSYVVGVSFEATNPNLAVKVANRTAEIYIESQSARKDQALARAVRWVNQEVTELSGTLANAESAVLEYRIHHHLVSREGQSLNQQQLVDLSSLLANSRAELATREARRGEVATGRTDPTTTSDVVLSDSLARLRDQEVAARQRLSNALTTAGNSHPAALAARTALADVKQAITQQQQNILKTVTTEVDIARRREQQLLLKVSALEAEVGTTQRDEAAARNLQREADALRSLYESLLSRQKQVATQVGIQQPDAVLASPATLPNGPSFPNRPLLVSISFIVSGFLGSGFAFLRELRRTGFETSKDVAMATGFELVGIVPQVPHRRGRLGFDLAADVVARPRAAAAEAIRTLRNSVSGPEGRWPRTLSITSSLPGEGKTDVALAITRSLVTSGWRVLLIESDLRRPTLARLASVRRLANGLVSVVEGRSQLEDSVITDPASTLHVLPVESKVSSPQDFLVSPGFRALMAQAASDYDYVVLDAPPISVVSDAVLIGYAVEGTLLVVRAGSTGSPWVIDALRSIMMAKLKLVGIALNGVGDVTTARAGGMPGDVSRAVTAYLRG